MLIFIEYVYVHIQVNELFAGVQLKEAQVFSIEMNKAVEPKLVKIYIHFIDK